MSEVAPRIAAPCAANDWLGAHVERLCTSFTRLTGRELLPAPAHGTRGHAAWQAPFALLSHGVEADPLFNYGNRTALALFELDWPAFVLLPSRASAEAPRQEARAELMRKVLEQGFIDDYSGVRIAASGRRFVIENATVWNVVDETGHLHGQAATFATWRDLPD